MNEKTLRMLEFAEIRQALAARTHSLPGQELALALTPTTVFEQVQAWQQETQAAVNLLLAEGKIPLAGIAPLGPLLKKTTLGGTLSPAEFVQVMGTLGAIRRLRKFLVTRAKDTCLFPYSARLPELNQLEMQLTAAISPEGEIKPDASPKLSRLYREQRVSQQKLQEKLTALLHSYSPYLQEPLITLRSGRYVLPVKQESRSHVPGLIHDQSASGATLFIEPMPVVDLNNNLRQLAAQIAAEEERILAALSAQVGACAPELELGLATLAALDCLFAKAQLALDQKAIAPRLNRKGQYRLRQARHPLLQGKVVPIDLELGFDFTTLVITGPNTGGKTVSLKTLGLLTLMAQAGLQIPAGDGSELSVATAIYTDIGDEQSIQQNLSTFSAHMQNLVRIMNFVANAASGAQVLVLLDELGAGTDPAEGAALAMAMLEYLKAHQVRVLATTHYSELKSYAYLTPGVANASVEFDLATLSPTYHLEIGAPGQSNAFAIAARLGLAQELIAKAKSYLNEDTLKIEEMIAAIQRDRQAAAADRTRYQKAREEAERLRAELAQQQAELAAKKKALLEEATTEAEMLLQKARHQADQLIGQLRKQLERASEAGKNKGEIEAEAVARRQELAALQAEVVGMKPRQEATAPPKVSPALRRSLKPGQRVYVRNLDMEATVLQKPAAAETEVHLQAGIIKIKVPIAELELITPKGQKEARGSVRLPGFQGAATIKSEVHLRGMTCDEALDELRKYLDAALLQNLKNIRIVHGKGEGILREHVRSFLRAHPQIASFRPGAYNEGGDGVTVAELK